MEHPSFLGIKDFTYELPDDKIAQYPLSKRDESKLLVFKSGSEISESSFKNIGDFLEKDTLLVFNNTRVIPARLTFLNDDNKQIEVFCLEPSEELHVSQAMAKKGSARWNCLVGHLKQWRQKTLCLISNGVSLSVTIVERKENYVVVDFFWEPEDLTFAEILDVIGIVPIPPYLNRGSDASDVTNYQTIYATHNGSVAAPTAGLHFTDFVFEMLKTKPVLCAEVTLHVGAGTFKPVKSDTMQGHEMHAEWIEVDVAAIKQILKQTVNQFKVIVVGTTSLRTIESLYWMGLKVMANPASTVKDLEVGQWEPYENNIQQTSVAESLSALINWMEQHHLNKIICRTQILIAPPYQLKIAHGIVTNFHQPQSTLLLLVAAIVGEQWKEIYKYALTNNFRFLSYGDSSLLLK